VQVPPRGTFVIKSGTDFKGLTVIKLTLEPPAAGADAVGASQQQQRQQSQTQSPVRRLRVEHGYIPVTRATSPSDAAVEAVVKEYSAALGSRLDREIGATAVDLEGRFSAVRTRESNLGNLMTDVLRRACSADVCLLNSGTFRCVQWGVDKGCILCVVSLW
jgi:2',3'-cyclic-nucleotide 2'-phosphodiesterase (5'-nucleotidase family)